MELASWRLIYLTNLPVAALALFAANRWVFESRDHSAPPGLDVPGALLVTAGLTFVTWALIHAGEHGIGGSGMAVAGAGGAALAGFVAVQLRSSHPMLPLGLFSNRQFTGINLVTLAVYGALGVLFFLLMLQLQQVVGYSPLAAGLAASPITLLLLALSARAGALAEEIGPRWPMTLGVLTMAAGTLLLAGVDGDARYIPHVLPGMLVFGVGLAATVAPLTAAVLAAADARHVGVASGVNNALSRGAGLLAIAVLPGLAGLTGEAYLDPEAFTRGFRWAMLLTSGLLAVGALLAAALVRDRLTDRRPACPYSRQPRRYHCPVDAAPLASSPEDPRA